MYTTAGFTHRQLERELEAEITAFDRYIDIGVTLHVIARDSSGVPMVPGVAAPMRIIRTHVLGGMLDTKASPPAICGPSIAPRVWFCSEDQEPVILHSDEELLGQLVYGSEGSGKSTAIAMWLYCRWLEMIGEGREIGAVAPTKRRMKMVRDELFKLWAADWYEFKKSLELLVLADGTRIQWVSTKKQSTAGGSPLQGFNWSAGAQDELQDIDDEIHDDMGQRLRAAKNGRGKRIGSCTAKETSAFRNRRDMMLKSGEWVKRTMLIARSPFIDPSYIERRRREISDREFRRRFEAIDLPPDAATYPAFAREHNLIAMPASAREIISNVADVLGVPMNQWVDVTARELSRWGDNLQMLGGHDPGSLHDVTELLKAFDVTFLQKDGTIKIYVCWVVVDEVTTDHTTTEQHVTKLLERLRTRWKLHQLDHNGNPSASSGKLLIRADPYGNNDSKPDRSCYTLFRNAGITTHPAAYSHDGSKPGRVPKNEGIELVNTLFCNAAKLRRLYVALNADGSPVAKRLVQALEEDERDLAGKAEVQRKDKNDLSHWPAALRYALWAIERPRIGGST